MENKLTSMTYFVLVQENAYWNGKEFEYGDTCINNIINYAYFLKKPLELWMFVPCDENNMPLEYPIDIYYKPDFNCQKYPQECYLHDLEQYQQAKERVLFEGFTLYEKVLIFNEIYPIDSLVKTVEDLVKFKPILTPTEIKQIYENNK
jgi:hypothetical protein